MHAWWHAIMLMDFGVSRQKTHMPLMWKCETERGKSLRHIKKSENRRKIKANIFTLDICWHWMICWNIIPIIPKKEESQKQSKRKKKERTYEAMIPVAFVLSEIKQGDIMPAGKAGHWYYTILATSSRNTAPVYLASCSVFLHLTQPSMCWSVHSCVKPCCGWHFSRNWNLKPAA